jgi:restriction system protein
MTTGRMSYTDAAEEVLRRFGKGAPMNYRRITELSIEHELIEPGGLTPEASMNASINQEIKRRERQGEDQRFKALGRGMYGLATPVGPLGGAAEAKNHEVRVRLQKLLSEMDPQAFEALVGELLVALGFENVVVTKYGGDGGIDVTGDLVVGGITDVSTAIQVKRWANNVPGRIVRELRGALGPHEQGLIITLSDFTADARNEASAENRTPISLVNGDRFVDLLMEHEIGVTRRRISIYELDEGAFLQTDVPPDEGTTAEEPASRPRGARPVLKTQKALSVWPLPGGRSAWKSTLDQMLEHVAAEAPSVEEAIAWLIDTFE